MKILLLITLILISSACGGGGESNGEISKTITGRLESTDFTDSDDFHYDLIEIGSVTEGKNITVDIVPEGFDAVVMLFEENNDSSVAYIDDYQLGLSETLDYEPINSSKYIIGVSSYSSGETGRYSLTYTITEIAVDDSTSGDSDNDSSSSDDGGCHHSQSCGTCGHFSYLSCSCVSDFYCN